MNERIDLERAAGYFQAIDAWVLDRQRELTAIPAPSFEEGPRGERMAELFREMGLVDVQRDEVGNVLASLPAHPSGPDPLIVSAHLDTVFPEGTDVTPRGTGEVIRAPGIADDGRGLAALLGMARGILELELNPQIPLLLVATVGEEGMGNLTGVKHLFRQDGPWRGARGFISLDGVGLDRIITRGVGSTRLRIQVLGPGGHSWTDWGLPNPIHILGRIVSGLEDLPLPSVPRTTATVARWGGGRSINAIPQGAWVEVDLRSEGQEELVRLEDAFRARCERETEAARRGGAGSDAPVSLEVEELGRRPAGGVDPEVGLVKAAMEASRRLGVSPTLTSSSTDANIPMSLGISGITMGAGGRAGGTHTLDEWYSNQEGPEGILRALLTVLYLQ